MATPRGYVQQVQGVGNWGVGLNANWGLLDTDIQALYDWMDAAETGYDTEADIVAGGFNDPDGWVVVNAIAALLNAAGFSLADIVAFLTVGHHADGTNKTGSFTFDEWEDAALNPSPPEWVDANTFKIIGVNVLNILQPLVPMKLNYSTSGDVFIHVKKSVMSGADTVITTWDNDPALADPGAETLIASSSTYRPNWYAVLANLTPGALMADWIAFGQFSGAEYFYYDPAEFSSPFTATTAKNETGQLAKIVYGSGLELGFTYASAGGLASKVEYRLFISAAATIVYTRTFTYDGTTDFLTDSVPS